MHVDCHCRCSHSTNVATVTDITSRSTAEVADLAEQLAILMSLGDDIVRMVGATLYRAGQFARTVHSTSIVCRRIY